MMVCRIPNQVVVWFSLPSPSHSFALDASQLHTQCMLHFMIWFVEVLPPSHLYEVLGGTCNSYKKTSHSIALKPLLHVREVLGHWKWGGSLKNCTSSRGGLNTQLLQLGLMRFMQSLPSMEWMSLSLLLLYGSFDILTTNFLQGLVHTTHHWSNHALSQSSQSPWSIFLNHPPFELLGQHSNSWRRRDIFWMPCAWNPSNKW